MRWPSNWPLVYISYIYFSHFICILLTYHSLEVLSTRLRTSYMRPSTKLLRSRCVQDRCRITSMPAPCPLGFLLAPAIPFTSFMAIPKLFLTTLEIISVQILEVAIASFRPVLHHPPIASVAIIFKIKVTYLNMCFPPQAPVAYY